MSHYHIEIGVDKDEIVIIKRDFEKFVHEADGFTIHLSPDNDVEGYEELQETIKTLFLRLIVIVAQGNFRGIN